MSVVLTFADLEADALSKAARETLTLARSLAEAHAWPLHAMVIGRPTEATRSELAVLGVATIHAAVHDALDADAAAAAVAAAIVDLQGQLAARVVMGSGSDGTAEIMAHVGAQLDRPLIANCTAVSPAAEGGWMATRVRWGGVLLEDVHLRADVALLTAAPHQAPARDAGTPGPAQLREFAPVLQPELHTARVRDRTTARAGMSLATARVVISGGRGVGSADGFEILEELAQLLGGAVGCSRVATNNGWRSHNDQIGQTGTRVAPDLYVACGISGATQHWVGCMSAKRILAINTDPEAPMVTRAHYAVIGDLHELLPAVVAEVRARRTG